MLKIAVLVSGGGTDLQSIIDAIENKEISCNIEMVIGSKDKIYALERAKNHDIPTYVVSKKEFKDKSSDRF